MRRIAVLSNAKRIDHGNTNADEHIGRVYWRFLKGSSWRETGHLSDAARP